MKICDNGVVRNMIPEEILQFEEEAALCGGIFQPSEPTAEERLKALEAAMLELLGLSNADDLYHK